jgi:hypothetical protein
MGLAVEVVVQPSGLFISYFLNTNHLAQSDIPSLAPSYKSVYHFSLSLCGIYK